MKVKVVRGFCLATGKDVFPGQVLDLKETDHQVRAWIQGGRLKPLVGEGEIMGNPTEITLSGRGLDPAEKRGR